MATIYNRGKYQFQARVRRNGISKAKTFTTRKEAEEWALNTEAEILKGVFADRTGLEKTTLGEALEAYRKDVIPNKNGEVQETSRVKAWLKCPLSKYRLAALKPTHFLQYVNQRRESVADSTILRDLMVIQSVLTMLRDEWELPIDEKLLRPAVRRLKPSKDGGRRLKPGEEARLLSAAAQYASWAPHYIILAIDTGMRRGELANLTWDQVDLENGLIRLKHGTTKNGDARPVPLTIQAEKALSALWQLKHNQEKQIIECKSGKRIGCSLKKTIGSGAGSDKVLFAVTRADSISQMFMRVRDRAGIPDIRLHDLRHEAASRLAAHVTPGTLAKIMGWRDIQMAMRYYKVDEVELVGAVRKLEQERNALAA